MKLSPRQQAAWEYLNRAGRASATLMHKHGFRGDTLGALVKRGLIRYEMRSADRAPFRVYYRVDFDKELALEVYRNRVVKGWAFRDHSVDTQVAIRRFLRTGLREELPEQYQANFDPVAAQFKQDMGIAAVQEGETEEQGHG